MTDTPNAADTGSITGAAASATAPASPVNTVIVDSAKTAAQAAETAADAVAVKEEGKAESWLRKEWQPLEAELQAVHAKMAAFVKAHL